MSEQRPFPVLPVVIVVGAVVLLMGVTMVAMMSWGMNNHHRGGSAVAATPTVITAGEFTIDIRDFDFQPSNASVPSGASVTWTNDDSAPHNARARDDSWGTDNLGKNESGTVTFDAPGTWDYHCTLHPYMKGAITVR